MILSLSKTYDPKPVESKWSRMWQDKKVFASKIDKNKKSFVIVIPPPNITGALHMGHALNNTLQDVLIRYNRMLGFEAYWVPGTDHGGIATQNVLEKMLKSRGKRKEDIGREKFLELMWNWHKECGDTILNQLQKLGCALNFSPENVRFTMDDKRAKAVFASFKNLWDKGLIYRGERMINWCPRCGTALSDIEVEYEEEKSKLWHIHYPLENGERGITIATTRPETMLGDTAVAVNPEDERYANLTGKKVRLPLVDRIIPVIADEKVEKSFGTGALKITPGHDLLDFEIGQRHNLLIETVISFEGKMTNCPPKYAGKSIQTARKEVVEDLNAGGFLEKEEHYKHSVGKCYRCMTHIEPLLSEQWFVKMKTMAEPAIQAAQKEEVKFYPETWKKPFIEWLKNIQDWCVSRQIWWGHRIPAWYCAKCSKNGLIFSENGILNRITFKHGAKPIISDNKPDKCSDCGSDELVQDPDVLDTWFSSALWPFSVFGWPEKTAELAYYYPTSVLVTGYEILYLWVARMVMSGMEYMGRIPFDYVYIHGTVRDKHGKRMSKSLGNGIDPLVMMEKYGTDAMRFSLISQAIGGKDMPFAEESIIGGRNFVNKLYNVSRFISMNLNENPKTNVQAKPELSDRWISDRFHEVMQSARKYMLEYDLPNALLTIYHFTWDEFCDWYLELAKPRLQTEEKDHVMCLILHIFSRIIKALHPFMPYVTEEIYDSLKHSIGGKEFLINETYPASDAAASDSEALRTMSSIMDIIVEIRTIRAQFEIHPSKEIDVILASKDAKALDNVKENSSYINRLAKVSNLKFTADNAKPKRAVSAISGPFNIYALTDGIIDFEKEKDRTLKTMEKLSKELAFCEEKLKNPDFINHAPEIELKRVSERKKETSGKIERLRKILEELD
ncbi:MAG: valine--tRNA ligase [Elusimicrobia bacterium]|nr:valine--tRNA ligase [Elusimicrobiota bacterium]